MDYQRSFGPRSRRIAPFTREGKVKWYSVDERFVEINAGTRYRVAASSKGLPFRRASDSPPSPSVMPLMHICMYIMCHAYMHDSRTYAETACTVT